MKNDVNCAGTGFMLSNGIYWIMFLQQIFTNNRPDNKKTFHVNSG